MKKIILVFLVSFSIINSIYSKPILSKSKYIISTLYDKASGSVSIGNSTYHLAYYPDRTINNVTDSDYWEIECINGLEYTFRNVATKKYIKYNNTTTDRASLEFSDTLMSDKSTSFTLELKQTDNVCYYLIRTVLNNVKVWDRRTTIQGNIYPVGVYDASGSDIQCYVFHDSEGNTVADDGKESVAFPSATQTLGIFASYLDSFLLNGKVPAVDTSNSTFYVNVPNNKMNTFGSMKVNFSPKNSAYKLYINTYETGNNEDMRFFFGDDPVSIQIRNGTTVLASGTIIVSNLPFVQLYTDNEITSVYNLGRTVVTEPDSVKPAEIMFSNLKIRGDYAARVEKKAYAVKLKDVDGETSMDRSFFGLRSDNNWILDAMYIDPARMRNRVSTDLWNDFSTKTYYFPYEQEMINGTRGRFVEVFLNDSYNGLYCMTEKIDRKQLNLKKLKYSDDSITVTQRGALYKASSWSIGTQLGNPITWGTNILPDYDNNSESWTAFDVKYPDLGDGEPINWKPAYDAVKIPYWQTSDEVFTANVATYFDLPVFIDYYLFLDLMLASDNHGKNYYLSVYNQQESPMVSLTPWDLDGVWGRRWDGSSNLTYANQSFETYIINNEPRQNNLYLRSMANNTLGFNDKLKTRYETLRMNYFSFDSLMNRFYDYNNLFKLSGADTRERKRWNIGSFDTEMTFISEWIKARLEYLDMQYLGHLYTAVPENFASTVIFAPNPASGLIKVYNAVCGTEIKIIDMQGRIVLKALSEGNETKIDVSRLQTGVYILKTGDKILKLIKK